MRFDERHLRTGADRSDHVRDVFVVRPADKRGDPGLQRFAYFYTAQKQRQRYDARMNENVIIETNKNTHIAPNYHKHLRVCIIS